MRCRVSRVAVLMALIAVAVPAMAKQPFRQDSIVLLQPSSLLETRVSVEELASYIKRLSEVAARQVQTLSDQGARTGSIVFAVRPDGSRKIWLDLKPALSPSDASSTISALESAPPCPVREGTVVAAINVGFWGGKAPMMGMPFPAEWRAAIKGDAVEVTQLVDSIWPPTSTPGTSAQ